MKIVAIDNVFKHQHDASGLALAAIRNGEITALTLMQEIAPDLGSRAKQIPVMLLDSRVLTEASRMAELGKVSAGMSFGFKFMPLRDFVIDESVRYIRDPDDASEYPGARVIDDLNQSTSFTYV